MDAESASGWEVRNLTKTCGRKDVRGAWDEMGVGSACLGAGTLGVTSIAVEADVAVWAL